MPLYLVTRQSDAAEVWRYVAAQVVPGDYPLTSFDHVEVPDEPPVDPEYAGSWLITRLAFRSRFTSTEKVTIEMAALDDPAAPAGSRQLAASLRAYLADIQAAQFVDLARPDTRAGVQALEAYGLIGAGRATLILDAEPTATELFNA